MKPSELRSSDPPTSVMVHAACTQVVERPPEDRPRERESQRNALGPVTVALLGIVALGLVVSAITVVSREPFGITGVVLPTRPVTVTTTTASPPPPSSEVPIPPPVTRAPAVAPTAISPTNVQPGPEPSPPPPPPARSSATRAPPTHSQQSSVHPTTHRPFPQETTDFLGPPGTNA